MLQHQSIDNLLRKFSAVAVLSGMFWGGYLIKQHNEETTFISVRTGIGEIRKLSFEDGSSVWLNSNTSLKYAKYFQHYRKVMLEEGEVFCEVRYNESSPFSVTTNTGMTVNAPGTSFSIKSYSVLQEEQVSVLEGEVEVKKLHLKQGRGITFNKAAPHKMYAVDPAEMDWTKGNVVINNAELRSFLLTLENTYGVKIRVKNTALMACRITTSFNTADKIESILNNLKQAYCISNVISQNEIVLE